MMFGLSARNAKQVAWDLRWMKQPDLGAVVKIETASFDCPWTESELKAVLLSATDMGKVAVVYGEVAGYVIWENRRNGLRIMNLAVAENFRGMGIGRQMVQHLQNKLRLATPKWRCLTAMVDEYNEGAIRFMAACGFTALGVEREPYNVKGRDGIVFEWERERKSWPIAAECCGR